MDYDGLGRVTRVRQVVLDSGNVYTTNYQRDLLGRATRIEYPDRSGSGVATIDYSYTSLGSIDEVDGVVLGTVAEYYYYGSNVRQRFNDGPSVMFTPTYDSFGRATSYVIQRDEEEDPDVDFAYTYDNNGNILSKKFIHRTTDPANVYSYDNLDRVIRSDYHNGENEQFTYDDLGNRLTLNNRADSDVVYTHNNVNEYTGIGGATPLYDAAGNLTKDAAGYTYHYDYENRITKVRKTNDTVDVAIYTYDALGRRIAAQDSVGSATTHYYYDDGQRVLLETDGSDADQRYFVFGNYIDEVLVMTDNLSGTIADHYYGHDHLFSPVILFNGFGTVLERYEYDAYGKCAVLDADLTADADGLSDHANPYLFTGRRLDTLDAGDLTIYFYRARYNDPDTGRFMRRDPLGVDPVWLAGGGEGPVLQYRDGMNLYEYVGSRPVIGRDPSGMAWGYDCIACGVALAAKFGAGFGGAMWYCPRDDTWGDCVGQVLKEYFSLCELWDSFKGNPGEWVGAAACASCGVKAIAKLIKSTGPPPCCPPMRKKPGKCPPKPIPHPPVIHNRPQDQGQHGCPGGHMHYWEYHQSPYPECRLRHVRKWKCL